jgi:hypothetical protein
MEWIEHINAALVFEPEYAASKKNTKNNAVPLMEKCQWSSQWYEGFPPLGHPTLRQQKPRRMANLRDGR